MALRRQVASACAWRRSRRHRTPRRTCDGVIGAICRAQRHSSPLAAAPTVAGLSSHLRRRCSCVPLSTSTCRPPSLPTRARMIPSGRYSAATRVSLWMTARRANSTMQTTHRRWARSGSSFKDLTRPFPLNAGVLVASARAMSRHRLVAPRRRQRGYVRFGGKYAGASSRRCARPPRPSSRTCASVKSNVSHTLVSPCHYAYCVCSFATPRSSLPTLRVDSRRRHLSRGGASCRSSLRGSPIPNPSSAHACRRYYAPSASACQSSFSTLRSSAPTSRVAHWQTGWPW